MRKDPSSSRSQFESIAWGDSVWNLSLDPITGGLTRILNRQDALAMNWLRSPGSWDFREWVVDSSEGARSVDAQWGLIRTELTGTLHFAEVTRVAENAWKCVYRSSALTVTVHREIDSSGALVEDYRFINTGVVPMDLPLGSVSISTPFFDQYPDARESLEHRCHAHVWTGGASSWVNAFRMGTSAPHLGLIVTRGSLDGYSQAGATFNDRGVLLLHPGAMMLSGRGGEAGFSWRLFWHSGWEDFFNKLGDVSDFVRLSAEDYVVESGSCLKVSAVANKSLSGMELRANGAPVGFSEEGGRLKASIPVSEPGDLRVTLQDGERRSLLRAFVTPAVNVLMRKRLEFIVRKQQRCDPGDPLDGAYLAYDNELGKQVYNPAINDHNAGRERVGMGIFAARYLEICPAGAFRDELYASLRRYAAFIARELEDENGVVYEELGRKNEERIYNFPWVAHFHLALYRATGDLEQLDRFERVMRAYYRAPDSRRFYPIGIPARDGLRALERAGRTEAYQELLANLRSHADYFVSNGLNYPRSEVNFEQSIVGPSVHLLAEMHLITGEPSYLEAVRLQMPVLEAFAGFQPDARLHEISLRHWDAYWFGKTRVYGDTMPHYWSTVNALAYAYFGLSIKEADWLIRAEKVIKGNLTLFTPVGEGTAAYLYALRTNGQCGARNDPWANDQDFALVNLLIVRELANELAAKHHSPASSLAPDLG